MLTEAYPCLRLLLRFDTREFLNVLSIAFEGSEGGEGDGPTLPTRQVVVDTLLFVMIKDQSATATPFSASQVFRIVPCRNAHVTLVCNRFVTFSLLSPVK